MSYENTIDFKDHIVQYPNRFKQIIVAPGVVELVPTWIENTNEIIEPGTPVDSELFKKLKQNVTIYQQTLMSLEGQTVINLERSYLVGQNRVSLYIGGVKQYSGQDYVETNPNKLTMITPLEGGYKIEVIMFTASQALAEDFFEEAIAAIQATQAATDAADGALEARDATFFNWLTPVNRFVDIATVYPNPQKYDAVQVRGIGDESNAGKVFRWSGTVWEFKKEVIAGPYNYLENIVNSIPLGQTKIEGQRNFSEFHQLHKYLGGTLQFSVKGNRYFDFMIPVDKNDKLNVVFRKDTNDDFIKMRNFSIFGYSNSNAWLTYGTLSGGTMNTATPNNYTTTTGLTVMTTFTGNGIDFFHFYDTRGGLWRVEIDGVFVMNISTHSNVIQPSEVYNSSAKMARRQIARNLVQGTHEIKLIFQGADPSNPATTDGTTPTTARGWIRNNPAPSEVGLDPSTFMIYGTVFSELAKLLNEASNKEFAFSSKPAGTSFANQWFPEHNNIGTAFIGTTGYQKLIIDGDEVSLSTVTGYRDITNAKIIQVLEMKHPDDAQPLARMTMVTTINRDGVHIDTTFEFLKDTFIGSGYVNMFTGEGGFVRNLTTALGKTIEAIKTDGSITSIQEGDRSFSYMFTGATDKTDYYVGMKHRNASETLRLGKSNRFNGDLPVGATWLQHRDATLQKLYPQTLASHTFLAGENYRFAGSFFAGKVQLARKLITGL